MMQRRIVSENPCRGFSLIELLVVIAVVSVLMAVLLPTLAGARETAHRLRCASNQRQLMQASAAYSADHKSAVPDGGYGYLAASAGPYGRYCFLSRTRRALYMEYGAGNPLLWWCPNSGRRTGAYQRYTTGLTPSFFTTFIAGMNNNQDLTGYGYFVGENRGYTGTTAVSMEMGYLMRFSDAGATSRRIVWADPLSGPGADATGFSPWLFAVNTHDTGGNRTPEGAVQAFADGHAGFRHYVNGVNVGNWLGQGFLYGD